MPLQVIIPRQPLRMLRSCKLWDVYHYHLRETNVQVSGKLGSSWTLDTTQVLKITLWEKI